MINWQAIDTVLLDMDGTLLDLHYDNHFWTLHLPARYAEIFAISETQAREKIHSHIQAIEGTLNWYCLDYWSEHLGVDIPAIKRETRHHIKERPWTLEFLQFLQENKKRVYLVTNSHQAGVDIKFGETRIGDYFEEVITSHQFGHPKEVLGFWQALHKYLPFDKARTLFVDDNQEVLNAAQNFGLGVVLGIHQPDSQRPRTLDHQPAINYFNEIM